MLRPTAWAVLLSKRTGLVTSASGLLKCPPPVSSLQSGAAFVALGACGDEPCSLDPWQSACHSPSSSVALECVVKLRK